jgi:hypothetical protein
MTVRLRAVADTPVLQWHKLLPRQVCSSGHSDVYGMGCGTHYRREALGAGASLSGPALILEDTSTFWLHAGWQVQVDEYGHLIAGRTI